MDKIILDNGEEMEITDKQCELLLKTGAIYNSGENYYHLSDNVTFAEVEEFLKMT